jgi:hypothetical protein
MPVKQQKLRIPHPRSLPNLSLIGVPEGMQGRAPCAPAYPQRFNGDARFVWEKMFTDQGFIDHIRGLDGVEDQWYYAITEYLKRCAEIGALPFHPITEQEKNDAVIQSLSSARIALVKFVNGVGLFNRVKMYKACRDYKIKERGFGIVSWAYLRRIEDPTFEKWLTQAPSPRFLYSTDLKYTKIIQPNCHVWVRYPNSTRATIGFEIQVATPVSVPGNRLATRADLDNFVDRVIWKPIIRAHRFDGIGLRLF